MKEEIKKGNFKDIAASNAAVYCDDRVAFIEDFHRFEEKGAVRMGVVALMLCLKGHATLDINGQSYTMKKDDLLVCHPNIILENSTTSCDMRFRCICLSPEYVKQITLISNDGWDIFRFLDKSPILSLNVEEVNSFCQYYDLIRSKLTGTPRHHQKEVTSALLQAFLYEFHDFMERFVKVNPPTFTQSERLFRRFLQLLSNTYPKPRDLFMYAEELNISRKYLSVVCKRISGYPAMDIVSYFIMRDIQYLLKKSDMCIKEVANELNFPSMSFFGKFVKLRTGMSPKEYRECLVNGGHDPYAATADAISQFS